MRSFISLSIMFFLLCANVNPLQGVEELTTATPAATGQKEIMLYQMGLAAIQAGEFDKALYISQEMRMLNPAGEGGYRLSVMANFMKKDFYSVVAAVQVAKLNHVESLFLYKFMTQSLFFLGDFSATMQGFKKMENFMLRQQGQEKQA